VQNSSSALALRRTSPYMLMTIPRISQVTGGIPSLHSLFSYPSRRLCCLISLSPRLKFTLQYTATTCTIGSCFEFHTVAIWISHSCFLNQSYTTRLSLHAGIECHFHQINQPSIAVLFITLALRAIFVTKTKTKTRTIAPRSVSMKTRIMTVWITKTI